MRLPHRSIVALVLFSPALAIPACGSSSNQGSPASDAGATTDGSFSNTDGSGGVTPGDGGDSGSTIADSGPKGDTGILGDNCPAVDAGPFVEGPHGPLPTMAYGGGGILEAPQVITFTFPTTRGVSTLQSFGQTVTQSEWFAAVSKDYCINGGGTCIKPGAPGVSVPMTAAAAALYVDTGGQGTASTGVDLDSFMNQQIAAAVAAKTIPAPGPNSLYAFYFPPSSTISQSDPPSQQNESCYAFGGYHGAITYTDGKTQIAYAIIPDCQTSDPVADLENVTIAASHEVIEAVTDPGMGGWYLDQYFGGDAGPTAPQVRNEPWANANQFGEVGDNCESVLFSTWALDSGVQVQRIWSALAASEGHNPCIPVPAGESYYNASTDKVLYVAEVGSSFTIDVSAFSDMARGPWRLDALDWTPTQLTDSSNNPLQYLALEFVGDTDAGDGVSRLTCVNNKTTAKLKVTLLHDPSADTGLTGNEAWPEADGVVLSADVDQWFYTPTADGGQQQSFPYQVWPFAVITPAIAKTIGVTDAGIVDAKKLVGLRGGRRWQPVRGAGRALPTRPRFAK